MLNMKQSDCRFGGVGFAAGEDLSLKAGHLVKLNGGGDLVLPTAASDITPYVVGCGADQGYLVGAIPLTSAGNCRVKLSGTCDAGDLLVAKGDGRVEKGAAGGAAAVIGTAEEKGADGQHVLLRPVSVGAKGADGADGEDGAAGRDAGVLTVPRASFTVLTPASAVGYIAMLVLAGTIDSVWTFDFSAAPAGCKQYVAVADDGVLLTLVPIGGLDGSSARSVVPIPVALPVSAVIFGDVPAFGKYVGGTPDGMGPTYMMLTAAGMDIDLAPVVPVLRVVSVSGGLAYLSA